MPTLYTALSDYEFIARNNDFWRASEIHFRYETDARKVMICFCSIWVSLHREHPEVGLVEKLTGSLYWWVEQCVPSIHRECYRTF